MLKLLYFGHLMRRANSLEKTLMLGKVKSLSHVWLFVTSEPTQLMSIVLVMPLATQPSHPLSFSSPLAFNLSQNQGLFQGVDSLHQVAKVLELQLQHQYFQWYSGLIYFKIDWFDLLSVQGTLKSLLQHHSSKHQFFRALPSLQSSSHICAWLLERS